MKKILIVAAAIVLFSSSEVNAQVIKFPTKPEDLRPKLPGGLIPKPIDDALKQADRERLEAQRRAEEEARRVWALKDRLIREYNAVVTHYNQLQREAVKRKEEYERYQRLLSGDSPQMREEAYRQLRNAGVLGGNREDVKRDLRSGFGFVVFAKEVDHFEYIRFGQALGASAATGNPGPVMLYLQQLLAESKQTFMKNLSKLPGEARERALRELEGLLLKSLQQAMNGGRPVQVRFQGVDLVAGIASYNHWVDVRYSWPRLVKVGEQFGIQICTIRFDQQSFRIPMPNTHQPYVKIKINASIQ